MILDNGTLFLCTLQNTAPRGEMPVEKLVVYNKHWFQERTVGMNRQYLAKGVNERVDLYVYIHEDREVRAGQYVVVGDKDSGQQFRINSVNHVIEENTNLRYTTLEMQRLDNNYDVIYPET